MKKRNKFLTLLLALITLIAAALPMTAFAAGENGVITIDPPANHTIAAADFNAYKLFDVKVSAAPPISYAYTAVPGVDQFLAQTNGKYGANADAFLQWLQDSARTEAEIIALAKDLTANKSLFGALSATQASSSVKFSGMDYGYYLITGAGTRDGQKVISRSMLVLVPALVRDANNAVTGTTKDVQIKLKAEAPAIDKKVENHNVPGVDTWTDINIGDTVKFQLTSKVPDMTGYDKYTFIVYDTMSKGLTYKDGSVVVKLKDGANEITLTKSADYDVTVTAPAPGAVGEYANGTQIKIDFIGFINLKDKTGYTIEITYEATLNENAVVGKPGNPNKAQLEYSNNPYDEDSKGKTPETEVKVYTFDMVIYKYTGEKLPGTALAGAEFELREKGKTDTIKFVKLTNDPNYDYRVALPGEAGADATLVSGADGKIRIKGLDAGEYELKETKAPDGYNVIPGWITGIEIVKDANGDGQLQISGSPEQSVNVQNNTGGTLPGTGGIGTYIFFGLGGAMALLLIAGFLVYRKKKALGALDAE